MLICCYEGGIEVAQMLIQKGADVNARSKHGYTPLHQAAEFNKANMSKLLIDNGADVNAQNDEGVTPLLFSPSLDNLKVLMDNNANKNAQDNKGNSVFHRIASYRKFKICENSLILDH